MLDDLKERVEEIRKDRKKDGIKQLWVSKHTVELARTCVDYLSITGKRLGVRVTMPEVLHLALEDFMAENGILTEEEMNEVLDNAFEKIGKKEK